MAHLHDALRTTFEKAGIVALLGEDVFYDDVAQAMARIEMVELGLAR